jgi:primosomal protein N' (replication factor Y) (superfamily II helicase)
VAARATQRWVEVAIDAVGPAGGRTYTYEVPPRLADVSVGEAVLVEFGRRQALGIVLGEQAEPPDVETKPLLARVRSDGPLLPPLQVALARHIAARYLAPPALVVRQLLPVGLLERVELVAQVVPDADGARADDDIYAAVSAAAGDGLAVDDLPRQHSRAAVLRRLHDLERDGLITLEWRVRPAGAREKVERLVRLTEVGLAAAAALARGEGVDGRPLGERQRALLAELRATAEPLPAARLAERHGGSAIPGLRRRGLVEVEESVVQREPLAGRPEPVRGALPAGAELTSAQARLVEQVGALAVGGEHRGFLVEGVTASGKTAVYAAVIARALGAGRGALVLVPEIALAVPLLERLSRELGVPVALLHSALSEGERAESGAACGPARRPSSLARGWPCSPRLPIPA